MNSCYVTPLRFTTVNKQLKLPADGFGPVNQRIHKNMENPEKTLREKEEEQIPMKAYCLPDTSMVE